MLGVLAVFGFEGLMCYALGIRHAGESACETASLILMAINTIALFVYISKRYSEYDRRVQYSLMFSLVFKVALLLWDYYGTSVFVLPNSHFDSEAFHRGAVAFAESRAYKIENYSYIVGWVYRFFGVQRITAQFLNLILSFVGIDVFERALCVFEMGEEAKSRILIIAALLPNYAIMSVILIRECIISVILCFALYFFALWWKRGRLLHLFISTLIPLLACWFHSGAIAVTIGIAICVILSKKDNTGNHYLKISFLSVIVSIVAVLGFTYLFDLLSTSILSRFHGLGMDVIDSYIDEHNIYSATAGDTSTYTAGIAGLSGWRGILINSPIRVVYFLWVPMPWDIRGISDIIAFLGSSLFYGGTVFAALFVIIFRKTKDTRIKALVVAVLSIALSGAFIFAWGTDSAGSALRHREKFYFVYLLLFAVIWEIKRRTESNDQKVVSYVR